MKKIDKVMEELNLKGEIHLEMSSDGACTLNKDTCNKEKIIHDLCPEDFGLKDSKRCNIDYSCGECWNEKI